VYKDYSDGKIDSQKLIFKVDQEFGCPPELRNYIIKNPTDAKFSQIKKQVRAFNKAKENSQAPINILDVYYHRGTP